MLFFFYLTMLAVCICLIDEGKASSSRKGKEIQPSTSSTSSSSSQRSMSTSATSHEAMIHEYCAAMSQHRAKLNADKPLGYDKAYNEFYRNRQKTEATFKSHLGKVEHDARRMHAETLAKSRPRNIGKVIVQTRMKYEAEQKEHGSAMVGSLLRFMGDTLDNASSGSGGSNAAQRERSDFLSDKATARYAVHGAASRGHLLALEDYKKKEDRKKREDRKKSKSITQSTSKREEKR